MTVAVPRALKEEHAELHQELAHATKEPGAVGEAAEQAARLLDPHFVAEEQFALPPLGLLAAVSRGAHGLHVNSAMAALITVLIGVYVMPSFGAEPQPGSYEAVEGKVDQNTFQGWRVFHSACHVCHGAGATGTDIPPSLLPRMESMTPREFAARVLVRYRLLYPGDSRAAVNPTQDRQAVIDEVMAKKRGRRGRISMPGWEADEEINVHILDLYAYLSARADGMIGPGKPGILPTR